MILCGRREERSDGAVSTVSCFVALPAARITAVAPATRRRRSLSLPARLMPPNRCLPSVECSLGVNPAEATRWRPDSNCAASLSMASVNAVIGPTPGTVARRWLTELALCAACSLASSSARRALISLIYWRNRANISVATVGVSGCWLIANCTSTFAASLVTTRPNSAACHEPY